ncbi:MaoC family dehydratase [Psychrobacter raelei]|uniref:MaoC family dehydratase n=1 Tax=Psychrobacter raelei TaxID=2565531 RepID=UPI003F5DBC9B
MLSISQFQVGMTAEIKRSFSSDDVIKFAEVSGDTNPIHLDDEYAKQTMFGTRIVHGALASSLFSTLFANKLPGPGCIYLKAEHKYLRPIYLNEEITFVIKLVKIIEKKQRLIFETVALNQDKKCIVGSAEIYIP